MLQGVGEKPLLKIFSDKREMELAKLTEGKLANLTGVTPVKCQQESGTKEANGTTAVGIVYPREAKATGQRIA